MAPLRDSAPESGKPRESFIARALKWRAWIAGLVGVLAAAAVVVIFRFESAPRYPPLPEYVLEVDGGPTVDQPRPVVRPGSRISIKARPSTPVDGRIRASASIGRLRTGPPPYPVPVSRSDHGTVIIEGSTDEIFANIPPGQYEVIVEIGRPGEPATRVASQSIEWNPAGPSTGFP